MISRLLRLFQSQPPSLPPAEPDPPIGFGRETAWYAVPADDPAAVAEALGLRAVHSSSWRRGLAASEWPEGKLFVAPPVRGWVLAVGQELVRLCTDPSTRYPDEAARQAELRRLSERFGEAQYFASYPGFGVAAWARARGGEVARAYCYIGEMAQVVWDSGDRDPEEPPGDPDWGPNEQDVLFMAARWSLNPAALETLALPPSLGLLGDR